jgi:hypothetical protein
MEYFRTSIKVINTFKAERHIKSVSVLKFKLNSNPDSIKDFINFHIMKSISSF